MKNLPENGWHDMTVDVLSKQIPGPSSATTELCGLLFAGVDRDEFQARGVAVEVKVSRSSVNGSVRLNCTGVRCNGKEWNK